MTVTETGEGDTIRPSRHTRSAALPESLLLKFGSPRARPRLVQVYNPKTGWSTDHKKDVVTMDLLSQLHASGITLVEAKWRKHRRQINLSTFDFGSPA